MSSFLSHEEQKREKERKKKERKKENEGGEPEERLRSPNVIYSCKAKVQEVEHTDPSRAFHELLMVPYATDDIFLV